MVAGSFSSNTHVGFEVVDGSFYNGPYFVESIPFRRISLDAGKHTEIHVLISVGGAALFGSAAGSVTVTNPRTLHHMDFGAAPFDTVSTPFFLRDATVFHGKGRVIGAGRVTVFIKTDWFEGALIAWVIRNQCSFESEVLFKEPVDITRIKSGIAKKGIRMEGWMVRKEVREDWF